MEEGEEIPLGRRNAGMGYPETVAAREILSHGDSPHRDEAAR